MMGFHDVGSRKRLGQARDDFVRHINGPIKGDRGEMNAFKSCVQISAKASCCCFMVVEVGGVDPDLRPISSDLSSPNAYGSASTPGSGES